ncbi:LEAF RUST 10 DISEASE-RESISTANCE LOCUS RECEPTOR-LIKE PROTEIN KINASE-like 1.2 [Zea mays]|uniref:LEAF RUST 10 DISEASE-RESISTANCE LOCUS RECEPTOR-LIKE PROTEIN KINASE-like 1.2 n=1 Tax=Zea mays TaxID=4577 RepID=A0A3L6FT85_MAIZE|nr:LEAF RUST 10 DISEASE-RESISTANCE LOCUS RECEPTOR-LIKE PROTEIN KINASE-like 1.2 [Zea mays]
MPSKASPTTTTIRPSLKGCFGLRNHSIQDEKTRWLPNQRSRTPKFPTTASSVTERVRGLGPELTLQPYRCGEVNITYPFYLSDDTADVLGNSSSYCGYPGLAIDCVDDEYPTIQLGGGSSTGYSYNVTDIDYPTSTIYLADPDVLDDASCPRVDHNVTVSPSPTLWLNLSDYTVRYLLFFTNCSVHVLHVPNQSDISPIACASGSDGDDYSFVVPSEMPHQLLSQQCGQVTLVPVLQNATLTPVDPLWSTSGYRDALKQGFQLQWDSDMKTERCDDCERSSGKCAYNTSGEFVACLCADGHVTDHGCTNVTSQALESPRDREGRVRVCYPFHLASDATAVPGHDGESYCGYPGLAVSCDGGNKAVLNLGDHDYTVSRIDYANQTVSLADAGASSGCPVVDHNVTIPQDVRLSLLHSIDYLLFFAGCSFGPGAGPDPRPPKPPSIEPVTCGESGDLGKPAAAMTFVLPRAEVPPGDWASACRKVFQVPVLKGSVPPDAQHDPLWTSGGGYGEALRAGFQLGWDRGSGPCARCEQSGGKCGYGRAGEFLGCLCAGSRVDGGGDCSKMSAGSSDLPWFGPKSKTAVIAGVAAGAGVAILAAAIFLFVRRKRKQKRVVNSSSKLLKYSGSGGTPRSRVGDMESGSIEDPPTHLFTYEELEEATSCFDENRELGDGGFGTVYKGYLKDGRVVAVKRLYNNSYRRVEQFQNEAAILSGLRHPNLVMFYGCTSSQSRELLLVYEFVANGTTTNILLDADYHVKVADFGLSRLFPLDVTHVSTAPQGTPGYVDPEYHQCYQLTDKSDVYSFGVVLVELISSKPAVDVTRHRNEINLAGMAISKIQKCQLEELVDIDLGYETDPATKKAMTAVAELAFRCLQQNGEMRPPIKEVLEVLRSIQGEYQTGKDGDKNKDGPLSPTTVHAPWESRATTPNTSRD